MQIEMPPEGCRAQAAKTLEEPLSTDSSDDEQRGTFRYGKALEARKESYG